MSEVRVQVALHFTFDPAKEVPEIPEEITCTMAVGDELQPSKVPSSVVKEPVKAFWMDKMTALSLKAKKTAKKTEPKKTETKPAENNNNQQSLL